MFSTRYRYTCTDRACSRLTSKETLPLQVLSSPDEWNRSGSKLINGPTAPRRVLVRWQQRLLTDGEY